MYKVYRIICILYFFIRILDIYIYILASCKRIIDKT